MNDIFGDMLRDGMSTRDCLDSNQTIILMIKRRFCEIHEIPSKELTISQKNEMHVLRKMCVLLGYSGYDIVKRGCKKS